MSNYDEEIISQNVVNLISEEKLQEMEASGTVPPNQEFLTPDDIEDIPVDCIRTEVVYDNRSANKHWDYKDGIPSGTTVTGKDFSKYVKLIVHTYQSSTIGGVRGSCEVDLTQPSLQWDGSKQTYYAGSNVYYCHYIDDGSDDYVQSRTCMALVNSSKTSITVYSTKTSKYHQQANDGKIFMIEGVLKTPAMVYTGKELHEGNGIEIKDGVISYKQNRYFLTQDCYSGAGGQYLVGNGVYNTINCSVFNFEVPRDGVYFVMYNLAYQNPSGTATMRIYLDDAELTRITFSYTTMSVKTICGFANLTAGQHKLHLVISEHQNVNGVVAEYTMNKCYVIEL